MALAAGDAARTSATQERVRHIVINKLGEKCGLLSLASQSDSFDLGVGQPILSVSEGCAGPFQVRHTGRARVPALLTG
jgi:hypothetical protein